MQKQLLPELFNANAEGISQVKKNPEDKLNEVNPRNSQKKKKYKKRKEFIKNGKQ